MQEQLPRDVLVARLRRSYPAPGPSHQTTSSHIPALNYRAIHHQFLVKWPLTILEGNPPSETPDF